MKKAALCFSGQMRNVQKGFDLINKNLILPNVWDYEFDTFVHTWFQNDYVGKSHITSKGYATGNMESASTQTPNDIINLVYRLYDPKKMFIEKQRQFDTKDYDNRKSAYIVSQNTLSKNYSIHEVGRLKKQYEEEQNIEYNAVISLRFDYGLNTEILLDELDLTKVNMSTKGVHMGIGVDVTHGYMNSELFDYYSKFTFHIDNCFRNFGVEFCDERLMHKYFDLNGIPYYRNPNLDDYDLLRS